VCARKVAPVWNMFPVEKAARGGESGVVASSSWDVHWVVAAVDVDCGLGRATCKVVQIASDHWYRVRVLAEVGRESVAGGFLGSREVSAGVGSRLLDGGFARDASVVRWGGVGDVNMNVEVLDFAGASFRYSASVFSTREV
jgi:hypothetical protein